MLTASNPLAVMIANLRFNTRRDNNWTNWQTLQQVARCQSLLSEIAHQNRGVVVRTLSDGLLMTYSDPNSAIRSACAMQEAIHQSVQAQTKEQSPDLRIGMSFGAVDIEQGDMRGASIDLAYKLVRHAQSLQILIDESTFNSLGKETVTLCEPFDELNLRNSEKHTRIYQIFWSKELTELIKSREHLRTSNPARQRDSNLPRSKEYALAPDAELMLKFGNQSIKLDAKHSVVTIGRGTDNDLVINDRLVSRHHARIDFHGGNFIVTDNSVNGTYIRFDDGEEVVVQKDTCSLKDNGLISLGYTFGEQPPEVIRFLIMSKADAFFG